MISNIISHLMMSRMLISSSTFVLLVLFCLSLECNGRHLNSIIDDHHQQHNIEKKVAKLPSHSTIKQQGFVVDPFTVPDDVNLKKTEKSKDRINVDNNDDHKQQADCGSSKNKEMMKDQKVKKVKEEELVQRHHHHHHEHLHPKLLVTYRVPPKNKRVHQQQPGFNLDYSPPKTHPPSHN